MNKPYTKHKLNTMVKIRIGEEKNRVIKRRANANAVNFNSEDLDMDMPLVMVACSAMCPPFTVRIGRNNETLLNAHPTLKREYQTIGLRIGQVPSRSQRIAPWLSHKEAGHCAEPHAAHKLLNKVNGLRIDQMQFSLAYDVKNSQPHGYCGTCQMVFPQLR